MTANSGEPVDFGLDEEANGRLTELLTELDAKIRRGELNRREVLVALSDGVYDIAGSDDPDAVDATTRVEIVRQLEPALQSAGMTTLVPWEF